MLAAQIHNYIRQKTINILCIVFLLFAFEQLNADTEDNFLSLSPYQPNYLLPLSYNTNPLPPSSTPYNEKISKKEVKGQISIKSELIPHLFNPHLSLFLAYTQLLLWQEYAKHGFVRDTNYQPEMFIRYHFTNHLTRYGLKTLNFGYIHDSNGKGGNDERSWERLYLNLTLEKGHFYFSIKPWIRVTGVLEHSDYNPDIMDYMGHGQWLIAYHLKNNTFSLMSRNNLESGFKRGAVQLSWSFPIYQNIKGYIQYFHGYGQSLLEYKHRDNVIGIGLSLSDW